MTDVPALSVAASRDLLSMFVGKEVGAGVARRVYENLVDENTVIKIEDTARSFQNVAEWGFWNAHAWNKNIARWLAPCVNISPGGVVLLQKRCQPLPHNYKLPTKLPEFLTDLKPSNFGLYKGRLVAVDYGLHIAHVPVRMRCVRWST